MSVQINHIPQLQLMSGDIKNDCIKDLALMLEDLYNTGEQQGETPNKMRWSGFEKKNKDPHGSDIGYGLAGRIYKGKQLTIAENHLQFRKFNLVLKKAANKYINAYRQYEIDHTSVSSLPEKWELHFQHIWCVYQFEGDYNPIHYHDSMYPSTLSGFIHMNVPDGVASKWESNIAPSTNTRDIDGTTEIIWNCNSPRSAIDFRFPGNMFIIPVVGTWYMFPSWLNHVVYPYKGDGCRVSISWNIGIEWVWPND